MSHSDASFHFNKFDFFTAHVRSSVARRKAMAPINRQNAKSRHGRIAVPARARILPENFQCARLNVIIVPQ